MNREFMPVCQGDYLVENAEILPTPRPLFFFDKLEANRNKLLRETGGPDGLRLMAKTVKSPDLLRMYVDAGVTRFKASSVGEAEKALIPAGAKDILVSYPLLGPHVSDYLELCERFPDVRVSALLPNRECAEALSREAQERARSVDIFLDIDPYMHRTGVGFGDPLYRLAETVQALPGLRVTGLHAYDGHIHHDNPHALDIYAENLLRQLDETVRDLEKRDIAIEEVVTSSSITFAAASAAYRSQIPAYRWMHTVSPGTCVLWDSNYNDLQAGHFEYAMAVAARVVDVIDRDRAQIVTTDAGVKMGLSPDVGPVHVTAFGGYAAFGGSERHGTFVWLGHDRSTWTPLDSSSRKSVGDVVLLFPRHVCTTLNQYNYGYIVRNGRIAERICIAGRDG